jgi:hypothetical protein
MLNAGESFLRCSTLQPLIDKIEAGEPHDGADSRLSSLRREKIMCRENISTVMKVPVMIKAPAVKESPCCDGRIHREDNTPGEGMCAVKTTLAVRGCHLKLKEQSPRINLVEVLIPLGSVNGFTHEVDILF